MSPSQSSLPGTEHAEVEPFRSALRTLVVDAPTATISDPMQDLADVRVSNHRLERYLNPCNPSCSG